MAPPVMSSKRHDDSVADCGRSQTSSLFCSRGLVVVVEEREGRV
jgi:hypothetical protein